jgi:hypothetical protein
MCGLPPNRGLGNKGVQQIRTLYCGLLLDGVQRAVGFISSKRNSRNLFG